MKESSCNLKVFSEVKVIFIIIYKLVLKSPDPKTILPGLKRSIPQSTVVQAQKKFTTMASASASKEQLPNSPEEDIEKLSDENLVI